jgi:predicted nucleic-acid-binding protein
MNLNAAKQVLSEVVSILHLQHKLNRQKIMDVINEVMNQVPPEM